MGWAKTITRNAITQFYTQPTLSTREPQPPINWYHENGQEERIEVNDIPS